MLRRFLNWLFPPKNSMTHWKMRALELRVFNEGVDNCFEQAKILSREMKMAGLKHYIVDGTRQGVHHNWVQYEGEILDPSNTPHASLYVVTERIPV